MKKLILIISIFIFFAIFSKSWGEEIIMRCDNDDDLVYKWIDTTIGKGKVLVRDKAAWIKHCQTATSRIQIKKTLTINDKGSHCKAILKGWDEYNYFYDGISELYLDFILLTLITNREFIKKDKSGNIENIDKTETSYCEIIN